jgi:3-phenylpropionate/trans-cinnamate dioxygenase ferredoxin reductase subunit
MPTVVSDYLQQVHTVAGVSVRTGVAVAELTETNSGVLATLVNGERIEADQALIGTGILPNTALAEACGLPVDDGIVVDAQGRTADPDIFAAGDVVRAPSAFAGESLRMESWANAQNQAIVVARAALGRPDQYHDIPWFWSDQYDVNLQILGLPHRGVTVVTRGAPASGRGCWMMLQADGTFCGAVAVNAARELRGLRKLLAEGGMPDPIAWADA